MRWFHVRPKDTEQAKSVNFPMNLKTTNRHFRKMTFDNPCTANNIRQTMTSRGTYIRDVLESRYLCCPVSGVDESETKSALGNLRCRQIEPASEQNNKVGEEAQSAGQELNTNQVKIDGQDRMAVSHVYSQFNSTEKSTKDNGLSLIETDKSPLLLVDELFSPPLMTNHIWKFQPARPLYFTQKERAVLEMKEDLVPDDVFAGLIWLAIER